MDACVDRWIDRRTNHFTNDHAIHHWNNAQELEARRKKTNRENKLCALHNIYLIIIIIIFIKPI